MTIQEFNKKYKRQGGLKRLKELLSEGATLKRVASQYKVSRPTVLHWASEFKLERKTKKSSSRERIDAMLKFAKMYTQEAFEHAYKISHPYHYQIALREAYELGIF